MLDTNIVSFALRARPQKVLDRLRAVRPDETCISVVTLAELRSGAARSPATAKYGPLVDAFVAGVRVTSAEDTVLAKLRWFRKGGETSERQWRDVLGIVAVQRGRLDLPYLTGWARRLGVEDLLTRALADETGGF